MPAEHCEQCYDLKSTRWRSDAPHHLFRMPVPEPGSSEAPVFACANCLGEWGWSSMDGWVALGEPIRSRFATWPRMMSGSKAA